MERLLRPQLRFHFAGDIPTYATSDAFEPDVRANRLRLLNGIRAATRAVADFSRIEG